MFVIIITFSNVILFTVNTFNDTSYSVVVYSSLRHQWRLRSRLRPLQTRLMMQMTW